MTNAILASTDNQLVKKLIITKKHHFMKRIQLNNFTNANKTAIYLKERNYRVFLDFGRRVSFSNKKDMLKFLAESRLELKSIRCEIILISKALYSFASDAFLLYHNFGLNYFGSLISIFSLLNIASKNKGENSNNITMVNMYKCINNLQLIVDYIAEIHKSRNLYLEIQKLNVISENLRHIRERLDAIGATEQDKP